MNTVMITGGAGFIGSHLVERLIHDGYRVVCVDNFFTGTMDNLSSVVGNANLILEHRSITDNDIIIEYKKLYPELNTVFHLAAISSVKYSMDHVDEVMRVNYIATADLLVQAEECGIERFIFAGSAAEYGATDGHQLIESDASSVDNTLSPYGKSKYLATKIVSSSDIGTSLRCFNVYGPRQRRGEDGAVVPGFLSRCLVGEPMIVYGDGKQTRDFLYVADVVEAYCSTLRNHSTGVYNVASGASVRIIDLAELVSRVAGVNHNVVFMDARTGDILHSVASVDAFIGEFGWHPAVQLDAGLEATVNFYR